MLAYADTAPSPNRTAGGDASNDARGCCRYIACPAVLVLIHFIINQFRHKALDCKHILVIN